MSFFNNPGSLSKTGLVLINGLALSLAVSQLVTGPDESKQSDGYQAAEFYTFFAFDAAAHAIRLLSIIKPHDITNYTAKVLDGLQLATRVNSFSSVAPISEQIVIGTDSALHLANIGYAMN